MHRGRTRAQGVPGRRKGKAAWPREELDRIRTLRDILSRAAAPASTEMLSAAFKGRDSAPRRKAAQKALEILAAAGAAQRAGDGPDGKSRYFIPRESTGRQVCSLNQK